MSNVFTRFLQSNAKNLVIISAFLLAMAGAVGLGLAVNNNLRAASMPRDCDDNAIMRCGATTPKEFIGDVNSSNGGAQKDLKAIYADNRVAGLTSGEYTRFANTAKMGKVFKNGDVYVDNQIVMSGANSMGRQKFNSQRKSIVIGGKTYYYSPTSASFRANSIDAMVMFDAKGVVETVILTACGNPVWGTKKTPEYGCKMLNKTTVSGKLNTYKFNTTLETLKLATVNRVEYDFGDGSAKVVKTNPSEYVEHAYTKAGNFTAKVTVYFNVPGRQVVASTSAKCATQIEVKMPYFTCDAVLPRALNEEKTKFRFTVKTSQGNGASLKDADFTVDGSQTTTGVTTKDEDGNIYKEYELARDGKTHKVVVKVNFNLADGVQSKTCEAEVKAGETPMCPLPGKEQYPVDSPECEADKEECKPGVPVGSPDCEEYECPIPGKEDLPKEECVETPPELPKTGAGSMLGAFVGTSAVGAIGHRLYMNRRRNG
jgi:hypothetical protein